MNKHKKLFAVLTLVCFMFTLLPISAFAEDEVVTSGKCGENATWEFDEATGTLTISGTGDMYDYPYGASVAPWHNNCKPHHEGICTEITNIIIEEGITSIGVSAFWMCTQLETISIADSVRKIETFAISFSNKLENIHIPSNVSYIAPLVFEQCTELSSITVDDDNEFYVDCDGVLYNADMTELLVYPANRNENTYSIPTGIKMVNQYAFILADNYKLEKLYVPETVEELRANSLSSTMRALTEINVSENNQQYMSQNGVLFDKNMTTLLCYPCCKADAKYEIPVGVEKVESFSMASANNLKKIILPDTLIDFDEDHESNNLEAVIVDDNNSVYFDDNGVLYKRVDNGLELICYPKKKQDTAYTVLEGVKKLEYSQFKRNTQLQNVVLSEGLTSIDYHVFSGCTQLRSINIPEGVTEIGGNAFYKCINLQTVSLPKSLEYLGITEEHYCGLGLDAIDVFDHCTSLTDIYYAGTEEEWDKVVKGYPYGEDVNESLKNVTIHFNTEVTDGSVSAEKSYMEIQDSTLAGAHFPLKFKFNDRDGNPTIATGSIYCWVEKDGVLYNEYGYEFHPTNINGGTWRPNFENGLFYIGIEETKTNGMFEMEIYDAGEYTICYAFAKPAFQNGEFVRPAITKEHLLSVIIPSGITTQAVANGNELNLEDNAYNVDLVSGSEGVTFVIMFSSPDGDMRGCEVNYRHTDALKVETLEHVIDDVFGTVVFTVLDTGILGEHQLTLEVEEFYSLPFNINVVGEDDSTDSDSGSTGGSTGGIIGGGSSGGGGGAITTNPVEITSSDDSVKLSTEQVDVEVWGAAASALSEDENAKVIISTGSSASISATDENGKEVTAFDKPIKVTVPIGADVLKNAEDKSKLTLALVTTDENGDTKLEYVGGIYDSKADTFTAYTDKPGDYVLVEKSDIVKIDMFIGNNTSIINGEAVANDVAAYIANDRTMVPAAFIMDQLGCKVDWFGDERKVVITLPDGSQLSMIIDQEIPGFGAVPVIKDDRTMVPIAYIADAMGAHVLWVGDEHRVVIVK